MAPSVLDTMADIARQGFRGQQPPDLRIHLRKPVFVSDLNNDFYPHTSFRVEPEIAITHRTARAASLQAIAKGDRPLPG